MHSEAEQIQFLRAELAKLQKQLDKEKSQKQEAKSKLSQATKKLTKTEAKLEKAEQRLEKSEKKNQKLEQNNQKLEQKVKNFEVTYVYTQVITNNVLKSCLARLAQYYPDIPEAEADRLKWLVDKALDDQQDVLRSGAEAFVAFLMSTGTESIDNIFKKAKNFTPQQALQSQKPILDTIQKEISSIEEKERETQDILTPLSVGAIEASNANPDDKTLQAVAQVAQAPEAPKPEVKSVIKAAKGKKTAGRQVLDKSSGSTYEQPFVEQGKCPHCGQVHPRKHVGDCDTFMRHVMIGLRDLIKQDRFKCPVVVCQGCHTVFADRPQAMPVPYSHAPGVNTAADLVIECGNMTAAGIPLNRTDDLLGCKELPQLATENFARPVQSWATSGIGGIFAEQIKVRARQAEYIGADETGFPVLEKTETSGEPHLLVCSTPETENNRFVVYEYLPSRKGIDIAKELQNWEFKVLIRDGYEGYNAAFNTTALSQREVTVQCCLVHARRRVCNALNMDWFKDIVDDPDAVDKIKSRYQEHSAQYLMCSILQALKKIYGWERYGKRKANETREQQLERILKYRQQYSKTLMDDIDVIMKKLAEKYAKEIKGAWVSERKDSSIGKAVVFWLNHQQELRNFLTDPRICPDNNNVERAVRAATVYRNAAFFKRSIDGAKAYCNLLTLRESAKLNGIADVPTWLNAMHRAFYEFVERYTWTDRYRGLAPGKKLRLKLHSIPDEAIAAFNWEPWLPWNYARTLKDDERCKPI